MKISVIYAAAAVAAIGAASLWYAGSTTQPGVSLALPSAEAAGNVDTSGIPEMSIGNPNAKVEVIEYASFTCPHCKHFHDTVWDKLKENYIDTGKIKFTYREVYFDRFGLWAALVARCGSNTQRYFAIADVIFDTQSDWIAGGKDPAVIADNLRRIGRTAGMTDDQVNACMNDADMAQKLVALYQKNAVADNVEGTPTFIINGQKYSNMSYEEMAKILDQKLAG